MLERINNFFQNLTFKKVILLFSIIGFILYANSFFNQLFWDDNESIVNNAYIKDWQYFPNYFSENLTAGAGIKGNYWRPLLLFSFSLDYKLGGLAPFFYHLQNLFWHIFSAILVFKFLKIILRKIPRPKSNFIAFFAAFLFLIHPLQTEAVTYVAGRADPMHSALMLLSLIYLAKFWQNQKERFNIFCSLLFFSLALMTKERAIVLCALVFLYLFLLASPKIFEKLKNKIFVFLPYLTLGLIYLILRATILHFSGTFDIGAQENIGAENLYQKILIILKGFAIYQELIIAPVKLYMEKTVSVPQNFLSPTVIIGLLTAIGWLIGIFYGYKKNRYIAFGVLWFFLAMSPSIHVFPIQGLLYEHWLYFPIIGIFLVLSFLIYKITFEIKKGNWQMIILGLLILWMLSLSAKTVIRNFDWQNSIKFYEKNISLGGSSARVFTNLGMAYADEGQPEKAIENYQKAIELNEKLFPPWFNLGNAYKELKQTKKSIANYEKAMELSPNYVPIYNNLATVYLGNKDYEEALEVLEKGIEKNPKNMQLYYNAAVVNLEKGDKKNARGYINKALEVYPDNLELMEFLWKIKK